MRLLLHNLCQSFRAFLRAPFSWKFLKIGSVIAYSFVKTSRLAHPCPSHGSDDQGSLCNILLIGCVKFCSRLYILLYNIEQYLGEDLKFTDSKTNKKRFRCKPHTVRQNLIQVNDLRVRWKKSLGSPFECLKYFKFWGCTLDWNK